MPAGGCERIAAPGMRRRISSVDPDGSIVRRKRLPVPPERRKGSAAPGMRRGAPSVDPDGSIVRRKRIAVPAGGCERIAAPGMRRRISSVDLNGIIVCPERLSVPPERRARDPHVDEHCGRGRLRAGRPAPADDGLVQLARDPGAAGQPRHRVGLCRVDHDLDRRAVPERAPGELLYAAMGLCHVQGRIALPVDHHVALAHDVYQDLCHAPLQRGARSALVEDGADVVDGRDVQAGRDGASPSSAPGGIKGGAPHDQLHRVVVGVGVQVHLQQASAHLLDHRREPDDDQVAYVGVGACKQRE